MELQSDVKMAAQCTISKYDVFTHWQRMCWTNCVLNK